MKAAMRSYVLIVSLPLVLSGGFATVQAADSGRVGTDADGNVYTVDVERLSKDGSVVAADVRTEYAQPRKIEGVDTPAFAALDRMLVDCAKGSFAVQSRTLVLADGTEVPRGVTPRDDVRFRPAAAGSMSESIVRFVCRATGATRPAG
jgi:hypothetical protein